MDCDNQEIEATKTIGSTDIEKVLKNLKNKHTKESIVLLDYIDKLEKENEELKETLKCTQDSWFNDTQKLDKLQKELENKE